MLAPSRTAARSSCGLYTKRTRAQRLNPKVEGIKKNAGTKVMVRYKPFTTLKQGDEIPDDRSIIDADGALKIELDVNGSNKILVTFADFLAYRKIDEGDALEMVRELEENVEENSVLIYEVSESDFMNWFHHQSYPIYKNRYLRQYLIVTYNSFIEVICFDPPSVEI